jgi:2-phospho-L-lactate guanylyltransferase
LTPLHALLPFRSRETAKSRLGIALDAEERDVLVLGMLANTVGALTAWPALDAVHVIVAADERAVPSASGSTPVSVRLSDGDLNEALRAGRDAAVAAGAAAVLILPGDLPLLTVEALDQLLNAADAALAAGGGEPLVVIVPADARGGTNALVLSPPGVIEPHFGVASFEAHLRAAADAHASVQIVDDVRLTFDLDTPDDLERLELTRQLELQALGEQLAGDLLFAASP